MAIFTFVLGFLFVAAGAAGLVASIDLLPTEMGLLYAGCGVLALCAGGVMLAIGALIRRLGAVAASLRSARGRGTWGDVAAPHEETLAPVEAPGPEEALEAPLEGEPVEFEAEPAELAEDDAVNENRAGHLPTMAEIEHAIGEPEAAPKLVGRYSAGGANYMIFSDGSIEAETEGGAFKFASMSEFKAYLAGAGASG
jgi:hypothetical protein